MATQQLDEARTEAFAEWMLDALNAGSLTLMTSVGYRTGLRVLHPALHDRVACARRRGPREPPGASRRPRSYWRRPASIASMFDRSKGDIFNNYYVATRS